MNRFCFFIMLVFTSSSLWAITPSDFDENNDARLDESEAKRYFSHYKHRPVAQAYDKDFNLVVDDDVLENLDDDGKKAAKKLMKNIERDGDDIYIAWTLDNTDNTGIDLTKLTYEQAEDAVGKSKKEDKKKDSLWTLGDSAKHLNMFEKDKAVSKRKQALLGYAKNRADDTEQSSAIGAIYWNSKLKAKESNGKGIGDLSRYGVSATFNRIKSNDPTKEIDSLSLRATQTWNNACKGGRMVHSLSALHNTNFDLDVKTYGIEYDFMPAEYGLFLGSTFLIGHFAYAQLQPNFNFLWAKVDEAAEGSNLKDGDDFVAGGVELEFSLWPRVKGLKKSNLTAKYASHNGVDSDKNATDLWTVSMSYPISNDGNISLSVVYQNGEDFIQDKELSHTTVGIGAKF